eukprot:gene10879-12035_t
MTPISTTESTTMSTVTTSTPGLLPSNSITPAPSSTTASRASSSVNPAPKVSYQKCASSDTYCKNGGDCFVGIGKICVCKGNYYGPNCENEGNPIFKPLIYALGGTCGFLLIVICISMICACRNPKRYSMSNDLDSFNNIGLRAKGTINESYD